MSVQHCVAFEHVNLVTSQPITTDSFAPKRRLHLYPLVETASLLDCAISLTEIPEAEEYVHNYQSDMKDNLFNEVSGGSKDLEAAQPENFLRCSRLSPLRQRRVLALRRRAVRTKSTRPAPVLPLPPVETIEELRAMRDWVFLEDPTIPADELPSLPLRLATHAINMSLIATALPVGVAMMCYSLCKGEDIKVTARMTTLTGLALIILTQNPELAAFMGA